MNEILEQIVEAHRAVEHDEPCTFCGAQWSPFTDGSRVREHKSTCVYNEFIHRLQEVEF